MKKISLFIIITSLCICTYAQRLSISELSSICGAGTYEKAEQILAQKGWIFFKGQSFNNGVNYHVTTFSYGRNKEDKAIGWFYLYTYDNKPIKLTYEFFDDEYYPIMRNSINGAGFITLSTTYDDETPILNYANGSFMLSLSSKTEKKDEGWRSYTDNRFQITLIRKGSVADSQNGKKTEYRSGKKYEYTLVNGKKHGEEKVYFGNGKLNILTHYVNGEEYGVYKEYDREGHLLMNGSYNKNGDFTGEERKYDDDGNIRKISHYINDNETGEYKCFDENGRIWKSGIMKNGDFTGIEKDYYDDGTIQYEEHIKDNVTHGLFKHYYPNGKLQLQWTFNEGIIEGPAKEWDEEGHLIFEGTIKGKNSFQYQEEEVVIDDVIVVETDVNTEYISGDFDDIPMAVRKHSSDSENEIPIPRYYTGKIWIYNDNGYLEQESFLKDDELHGESKYYEDGKLVKIQHYVDDEEEGLVKEWLPDGRIVRDGNIHNGKYSGIQIGYDDVSQKKQFEFHFKDDMFNGKQIMYRDNGTTAAQGDFENGIGQLTFYDTEQRIVKETRFINNSTKEGKENIYEYDENGVLNGIQYLSFKNDELDGEITIVMNDTLLYSSYLNGKRNGKSTLFISSDKKDIKAWESKKWIKIHETEFRNDKKNGIEWQRIEDNSQYAYIETTYKNDVKNGDYRISYSSTDDFNKATLYASFQYKNGKPNGNYYVNENGEKVIKRVFNNGRLVECKEKISLDEGAVLLINMSWITNSNGKEVWCCLYSFPDSIVSQNYLIPDYKSAKDLEMYQLVFPSLDYCDDTYNQFAMWVYMNILSKDNRFVKHGVYDLLDKVHNIKKNGSFYYGKKMEHGAHTMTTKIS